MLRSFFFRSPALLATSLSLSLLTLPIHRGLAADNTDSTVVARVGDTQVTAAELRAAIQTLDANTQAAAARDSNTLSQLVRALLAQRLVLKEAMAKKWDENPQVTAALARLRDTAIEQSYLESVSRPAADFPTDAQVQAAYDANKSKLLTPKQYDLAQIFIKDIKGSDVAVNAEAQVKLAAVKKALARKNADFGAIASAESDDQQTASKGGELGWLAESRIAPAIREQLGSMTKGSVSKPVQLDDGWHILKVLDVKEPATPTLDEIKPQLVQRMREEQARVNSQQYIAKLMQQNPVQIDELSLSKVLK